MDTPFYGNREKRIGQLQQEVKDFEAKGFMKEAKIKRKELEVVHHLTDEDFSKITTMKEYHACISDHLKS